MSERGFSPDQLTGGVLHAQERTVRFQDVDAASTIFYPRVLEYFSDAYVAALGAAGLDLPALVVAGPWLAPIVHAEVDYASPLFFGDTVSVAVARMRLGKSALTVGYAIRKRDAATTLAATGWTAHVFIDRATFKPCPIPADVAAMLAGLGAQR